MSRALGLEAVAALVGGTARGTTELVVSQIASPERATASEVAVLPQPASAEALASGAGILVASEKLGTSLGERPVVLVADTRHAFAALVAYFHPPEPSPVGIEPGAVVDPRARLGAEVFIAAGARIEAEVVLGDRAQVHAHVVVGRGSVVGAESVLHPHVVLYPQVELGSRVVVHAGAVLGRPGFGMRRGSAGWERIPQVGRVVIEDDVEIGAHCAVDRATLDETRIRRGAKLDNFVQVGHNTTLGEDVLVVAQVGLSGSVEVGRDSILLGQVGVADHARIAPGTTVGAGSGVSGRVGPGEWLGYPAMPAARARRVYGLLAQLPELRRRWGGQPPRPPGPIDAGCGDPEYGPEGGEPE